MRSGTLLVFIVTLTVCVALIQMGAEWIDGIRNESVILSGVIGAGCLVLGFLLPLMAAILWNRRGRRK